MKQNIKLNIRNVFISIYVLIVLGFSAFAKADVVRIQPWTPQQQNASKYEGFVAQAVDGRFYLVIDESLEIVYELRGSADFSEFNGWYVKVLGYENTMHKVGPVLSLQSFDPLINDEKEETVAIPLLNVVSISGVSPKE